MTINRKCARPGFRMLGSCGSRRGSPFVFNRAFAQYGVLRPLWLSSISAISLLALLAPACSGTSAAPARGRGGEGGPVPVVVARVGQRDVPVDIEGIGNVEAYSTISVRAQVTGQLTEVFFHEGDSVKKGDHLFTIDPRPFEAQLQQAEANLKRDQALENQAEAQLARDAANAEYLQLSAERNAQLNARGIISKDQAEQSRAQADATAATVKADKAAVESARAELVAQQAAVENAKVALSYTTIRSAIDGRTGNLAVKAGNLVAANTTELMTIAQVQPVYVTFAVPAVHLPTIKRHMTRDRLTVAATPQDAEAQPVGGELTFVDNAVDVSTDTIKLKATFPNHDRRLWPGQFARVSLRLATLPNATVVPTQAVQTGQDGQFIFVVKPDSTVEQRPIVVGQRVGEDVVINNGLSPGETIVTEGQLRLEPGTRVQTGNGRESTAPDGGRGRGGRGRARG
jgi:multidrug efflux system membrane fusion protein